MPGETTVAQLIEEVQAAYPKAINSQFRGTTAKGEVTSATFFIPDHPLYPERGLSVRFQVPTPENGHEAILNVGYSDPYHPEAATLRQIGQRPIEAQALSLRRGHEMRGDPVQNAIIIVRENLSRRG